MKAHKRRKWGVFLTAGLLMLSCACEKIQPEEDAGAQAAMANASVQTTAESETGTTAVTTTAVTTTVTTTTTTDASLYAPFIDKNANIDPNKPMVALTFDDGPSENTPTILDTMETYGGHATFFVVGENINDTTSQYMERAVSLGCEIGSHTYNHCDLAKATPEERKEVIQKTDDLVYQAIGRYPYWVRPPYGSFDDIVRGTIGRPLAFWSVDTKDWKTRNTASTVSASLQNIEDGDVVLMHDLYAETAAAVQQLVPTLVQQGYQLVTLSELTYYRGLDVQNGMIVFSMHPGKPNYKDPPTEAEVAAAESSAAAAAAAETTTTIVTTAAATAAQ